MNYIISWKEPAYSVHKPDHSEFLHEGQTVEEVHFATLSQALDFSLKMTKIEERSKVCCDATSAD